MKTNRALLTMDGAEAAKISVPAAFTASESLAIAPGWHHVLRPYRLRKMFLAGTWRASKFQPAS